MARVPTPCAVAAGTDVVSKLGRVIAKTQQIVGLVVVAVTGDEFRLPIAFKSGVRSDIKDAVNAVAVLGGVAAGLSLKLRDVLGIELGADVGGDVGVGNRNTVDCPCNLMAAANV